MKYARISNGELTTAKVIHDSAGKHDANAETPTIPTGWQLVADEITADEIASDGFPKLTRERLLMGMLSIGITSDMVEAVIAQIPDDTEREVAEIKWKERTMYRRTHPLVVQISAALSVSESDMDTAWNSAVNIDVTS